jgi:hypothetical protein
MIDRLGQHSSPGYSPSICGRRSSSRPRSSPTAAQREEISGSTSLGPYFAFRQAFGVSKIW